MRKKPNPLSYEAQALAWAEMRLAKGKRIIFGVDEDEELDPAIVKQYENPQEA